MESSSQTAQLNRFSRSSCHQRPSLPYQDLRSLPSLQIYRLQKNLISLMDDWHCPRIKQVRHPSKPWTVEKGSLKTLTMSFRCPWARASPASSCCLKRHAKCCGFNNFVLLLERGPSGILELTCCQRLKMLNFFCDEALFVWTNKVRASRSARPPTVG
ncbi:hypothetical protein ACFE04_001826 [Oxalis oulophora]